MNGARLIGAILISGAILLCACASRRQLNKMEGQLDYLERASGNIEKKLVQQDSLYRAQEEAQRVFLARLEATLTSFQSNLGELDNKLTDLNDRIGRLELMGIGRGSLPAAADTGGDSAAQRVRTVADPGVIYSSAFKNLQANNYDIAILGFREYITSFPSTDLTDDAQYWLGECFYQKEQYDSAKLEFDKVLQQYPKSDKLAGATFKLARAHEELKESQAAIKLYREILAKYPNTAEAGRAKVQLEGLGEK